MNTPHTHTDQARHLQYLISLSVTHTNTQTPQQNKRRKKTDSYSRVTAYPISQTAVMDIKEKEYSDVRAKGLKRKLCMCVCVCVLQ